MQSKIIAVVASKRFFYGIVGLLVLQAVWIALTGRYPMAFDEDFHFGIINLYSHHLSPIWAMQPAHADRYGAVFRDPSYLYQYLMSFPLRLTRLFTASQTIQVIVLRLIDVGLFASSLPLYRRLLLKVGASKALTHSALLAFVLIPIVPLLAGQINYDDLLLPVTAGILLQTLRVIADIRGSGPINTKWLSWLVISCLLASLVKYAFLPIFAAVVAAIGWEMVAKRQFRYALRRVVTGVTALSRRSQIILALLLVLSVSLFGERYVVNTVHYHTPIPQCGQVLSYKQCSAYGPWIRDYNYAAAKTDASRSPVTFLGDWLHGMWLRLYFSVAGPNLDYQTRGPLPIPSITAIVASITGFIGFIVSARALWRRYDQPAVRLLAITSLLYVGVLWLDDYSDFLHTGVPVAINGRYLLPVLPLLMIFAGLAFSTILRRQRRLKVLIATVVIFGLAWGGGLWTFVVRSSDGWYWPNQTVLDVNHAAQRLLRPLTPGNDRPTEFL